MINMWNNSIGTSEWVDPNHFCSRCQKPRSYNGYVFGNMCEYICCCGVGGVVVISTKGALIGDKNE
jgi:hypothetical protein